MSSENIVLHDMPYVVVNEIGKHPVAYPEAGWDKIAGRPASDDVEQCDCLATSVDYYRLRRERLYSDGESVLTDRDVEVLDALLAINEGRPRAPRHED